MISTRSIGFDIGVCLGLILGPLGYATCPVELGAGPSLTLTADGPATPLAKPQIALKSFDNGQPAPFLELLGHRARQRACPLYVAELIGQGDRKSIQPLAERLGLAMALRVTGWQEADCWTYDALTEARHSDPIRQDLRDSGAVPEIPTKRNRRVGHS